MKLVATGVVGHVDHGKTALVKALTGTDTDRLAEEKARGISIALGFAHLPAPEGGIDLIDMPGHERFVRTMISGATGIEAVLLVVAANEGLKPQTVEHLEIAALLGVRRGVVAVTKCDLTGQDTALEVASAARDLAASTGLPDMPVVLTSAATGSGIDELRACLADLTRMTTGPHDRGFFVLPVDRAFAVAGFGTVVTGTLRRGPISEGDEVEIFPGGKRARVRSLQAHGAPIATAAPGRRTAVNLRGVERSDLQRGHLIATPGVLATGSWLDVRLSLVPDAPRDLENGRMVRLLFGTSETEARIRLLDADRLVPGTAGMAQLHCRDPVAVAAGEPFVIRDHSPVRTVGGGTVLAPASARKRRFDPLVLKTLGVLAEGDPGAIVAHCLETGGPKGCPFSELVRLTGYGPAWLRPRLGRFGADLLADGTVVAQPARAALEARMVDAVTAFHRERPTELGLTRDRLRAELAPGLPPAAFEDLLAHLVARGRLSQDRGLVRRPDLDALGLLSPSDRVLVADIERAFRDGNLMPPDAKEVIGADRRRRQALHFLLRLGVLVRTVDRVQKRDILFHREAIAAAMNRLREAAGNPADGFTVGEAGRWLGITRKFSIPLLEHLDKVGFTQRDGDLRFRRDAEISSYEDGSSGLSAT